MSKFLGFPKPVQDSLHTTLSHKGTVGQDKSTEESSSHSPIFRNGSWIWYIFKRCSRTDSICKEGSGSNPMWTWCYRMWFARTRVCSILYRQRREFHVFYLCTRIHMTSPNFTGDYENFPISSRGSAIFPIYTRCYRLLSTWTKGHWSFSMPTNVFRISSKCP